MPTSDDLEFLQQQMVGYPLTRVAVDEYQILLVGSNFSLSISVGIQFQLVEPPSSGEFEADVRARSRESACGLVHFVGKVIRGVNTEGSDLVLTFSDGSYLKVLIRPEGGESGMVTFPGAPDYILL